MQLAALLLLPMRLLQLLLALVALQKAALAAWCSGRASLGPSSCGS